ncbi:GerMN domain-containing protein [Amycolatopsis granulosa]|uniref:GerMN domain-containing protein n=1 Tax=Amycolatopsis granulosa TaxID=185684 RepID=UPI00141D7AFE|nr:GerMN domain-containing protein [Amycolatopsis granulosa]NIH88563.1 hypothetical protein [Amycolatopsis granulosa]
MRWVALLLVLVLAGCGVRPTRPVGAGEGPIGVAPGPILYFQRAGATTPVLRQTGHLGTVREAVALLLAGPTPQEQDLDYYTAIGPVAASATSVGPVRDGVVTVDFTMPLEYVGQEAKAQIACTVIAVNAQLGANARNLLVRFRSVPGVTQLSGPDAFPAAAGPYAQDAPRGCPAMPR